MSDQVGGILEVGICDGEVVVNHPDLKPDANGVGHIVFSPGQARSFASLLLRKAREAEEEVAPSAIPEDILATSRVLDLEELRSAGYLQEVNRVFFHPLGLALAIQPDNPNEPLFVLDRRDDLEGFVFDDEAGLREKADLVDTQRQLRRIPRMEKLGYFVQPVEPFNNHGEVQDAATGKR